MPPTKTPPAKKAPPEAAAPPPEIVQQETPTKAPPAVDSLVVWRYHDPYEDRDVERHGLVVGVEDNGTDPPTARVAWLEVSGPMALDELEAVDEIS